MASVPSDINLGWSAAALCNSSRGTKVSSGIVWFERCRLSKEVCGLFAVTLPRQCRLPLPSLSRCQAKRPHTLGQIAFPLPKLTSFPSARRSVGCAAISRATWFSMSVVTCNSAWGDLFHMHEFLKMEQGKWVVNEFFIDTFTQNSFKNTALKGEKRKKKKKGWEYSFLHSNTVTNKFCIFHECSAIYRDILHSPNGVTGSPESFKKKKKKAKLCDWTGDIARWKLAGLVASFEMYLLFSIAPTRRWSFLHTYEMKSSAISSLFQCKIASLLMTHDISAKPSDFTLALNQLWVWNLCLSIAVGEPWWRIRLRTMCISCSF